MHIEKHNGNYTNTANQVDILLRSKRDDDLATGKKIANHLSKAEENLKVAYSADEDAAKKKGYGSLREYQFAMERAYQRCVESWQAFRELLKNAHQTVMEQIRALRA